MALLSYIPILSLCTSQAWFIPRACSSVMDDCRCVGGAYVKDNAIATREGFQGARSSPGALTPQPNLVLCSARGYKKVSALPSLLFLSFLLAGSWPSSLSFLFSCPFLFSLRCHYLCRPSDWPWLVAKPYVTPPGRPLLHFNPLL